MTNKIIYTRRIAMKLIEMGNIPTGTTPNPSKQDFLCWIFPVTNKFEKDLQTILNEKNKAVIANESTVRDGNSER